MSLASQSIFGRFLAYSDNKPHQYGVLSNVHHMKNAHNSIPSRVMSLILTCTSETDYWPPGRLDNNTVHPDMVSRQQLDSVRVKEEPVDVPPGRLDNNTGHPDMVSREQLDSVRVKEEPVDVLPGQLNNNTGHPDMVCPTELSGITTDPSTLSESVGDPHVLSETARQASVLSGTVGDYSVVLADGTSITVKREITSDEECADICNDADVQTDCDGDEPFCQFERLPLDVASCAPTQSEQRRSICADRLAALPMGAAVKEEAEPAVCLHDDVIETSQCNGAGLVSADSLMVYTMGQELPWRCSRCYRDFRRRDQLDSHVHTKSRPYHCDPCRLAFKPTDRCLHTRSKHSGVEGEIFTCDICSRPFKRPQSLKIHKQIHTSEKPFKCDHCSRGFTTNGGLKQHKVTHTGEKPYTCQICDKRFSSSSSLCSHRRIHFERKFKCEVCGKAFVKGASLKEHMIRHSGEKNHQCALCSEWFGTRSNLNRHVLTHDSGRKRTVICTVCGDAFYDQYALKSHMRVHSDEKPHRCHVCARAFKQYNNLKVHMRLHTGEKPYRCDICQRTFTHDYSLKKHKLTHMANTEKSCLKCPVCGKSFQFVGSYLEHQNTHTGQKPFSCNVCGETFTHRSKVSFHKRMCHNGGRSYRQVLRGDVTMATDVTDVTMVTDVTDVTMVTDVTDVTMVTDVTDVTMVTDVTDVTMATDVTDVAMVTDVTDVKAEPLPIDVSNYCADENVDNDVDDNFRNDVII